MVCIFKAIVFLVSPLSAVFEHLGCSVEWYIEEGTTITEAGAAAKQPVACVMGPVRKILLGERTALNIVTRASGIATEAQAVVELVRSAGWQGEVAGCLN